MTLELGGKSANVIFADADLERAAAAAPMAVFGNAGQDCCARSRILVQRSAVERFMELLEPRVQAIVVGDPLDEDTQMGPLIRAGQRETVASFVPDGRAGRDPGLGARRPRLLVCADRALPDRPPTSAPSARRSSARWPCVIPFEDEAEAVEIANDTIYGLSGSVWTENGARALRVARAMETGVLSINTNTSVRVATPFGGFKQSGFGRELGPHALDAYSELKSIYYATEG